MDRDEIIKAVRESACFRSEAAYVTADGYPVAEQARLFKHLENDKVRVFFPTTLSIVEEGAVVAIVCLYDLAKNETVYAHAVFAGPGCNASLKSLFVPPVQAKPQPGIVGNKAILKFVAWKQAAWSRFLVDELERGTNAASKWWIDSFWKALDRMYGGGHLLN